MLVRECIVTPRGRTCIDQGKGVPFRGKRRPRLAGKHDLRFRLCKPGRRFLLVRFRSGFAKGREEVGSTTVRDPTPASIALLHTVLNDDEEYGSVLVGQAATDAEFLLSKIELLERKAMVLESQKSCSDCGERSSRQEGHHAEWATSCPHCRQPTSWMAVRG